MRLPRHSTHRLGTVVLLAALIGLGTSDAAAQYLDARVLTRGTLRISFEPSYLSYDRRFDPDGEQEPLGTDLSADSAGPFLLPSLAAPQGAIRSILEDPSYRMNVGKVTTDLDADIRQVPFGFQFGLTNRVSLTATIPFVTARSQVALTVDSSDANVGWNLVASESGSATGRAETLALLAQLTSSTASLETLIAAGSFDCPTGPTCDAARALVTRTSALTSSLIQLGGIDAFGNVVSVLPPFVPLASSAAGQAVLAVIQDVATQLTGFGANTVTATLPLPTDPVSAADLNAVLTNPGFGYDAAPLEFIKYRQRLGDIEVGLRWGLVQKPTVRVALSTSVRLPTGFHETASNFVDFGTGDKQTDVVGGLEVTFEPGNAVSLALGGEYTLQLPDQLLRRITAPDSPIALAATEFTVSRNLGDVIRLRAFPAVRLHPSLTAYTTVDYFHKQVDVVTIAQSGNGGTPPDVTQLEIKTAMKRLSVGAGLHYRSLNRAGRVPVEAGVQYRTALQGSGGLTPLTTEMRFYLRLFYRIFGSRQGGPTDSTAN